ncbi:MAG: hypothetical protein H0U74_03500 [Bradymonadaceae bacterium]|nr:hypothetical protein [Lujinxingiaceae bacterium]
MKMPIASAVAAIMAVALGGGLARGDEPPTKVEPDSVLYPRWQSANASLTPALEVFLARDARRGFVSFARDGRRWTSPIFTMWKATVADVNGDGEDELVLGMWSRARRHDESSPHRTVWVMAWADDRLVPLWRGSALSLPLVDFQLADVDGDGTFELLAIESAGERCRWALYRWNGFGFWVDAQTALSCEAHLSSRSHCVMELGKERCATHVDGHWMLQ